MNEKIQEHIDTIGRWAAKVEVKVMRNGNVKVTGWSKEIENERHEYTFRKEDSRLLEKRRRWVDWRGRERSACDYKLAL